MEQTDSSSIIGMPPSIFRYLHLDRKGLKSVLLQLELKMCNKLFSPSEEMNWHSLPVETITGPVDR